MSVFAIGDLHLSNGKSKPMEIFGGNWKNHWDKIRSDWQEKVAENDLVLICGDISWAMYMQDALCDLEQICELSGSKLLLRGNHDYWWGSVSRLREILQKNTYVLQNDSFIFNDIAIVGTRGWINANGDENKKIYMREVQRLELSLKFKSLEGKRVLGMMHFPPFGENSMESEFTCLFESAKATDVIYGHLHGEGFKNIQGTSLNGVNYHLVSCDYLDFKLKQIT